MNLNEFKDDIHGEILQEIFFTTLLLGTFVYKRFLSRAAKACSHFSGDKKSNCMNTARIHAHKAEIKTIKSNMHKCNNTDSAEKCKNQAQAKILKLQGKIKELGG